MVLEVRERVFAIGDVGVDALVRGWGQGQGKVWVDFASVRSVLSIVRLVKVTPLWPTDQRPTRIP